MSEDPKELNTFQHIRISRATAFENLVRVLSGPPEQSLLPGPSKQPKQPKPTKQPKQPKRSKWVRQSRELRVFQELEQSKRLEQPKQSKQSKRPRQPKNNIRSITAEEQEQIREFWLRLSEEERQNLVEAEKEAVLKKLKERQKHSCRCAICSRKRRAIEEELGALYDVYYYELETYAQYQQQYLSTINKIQLLPGPFPGSVEFGRDGSIAYHHAHSSHQIPDLILHGEYAGKQTIPNTVSREGNSEFEDEEDEVKRYEDEDEEGKNAVKRGPSRRRPAKGGGENDPFIFGNNLADSGPGDTLTVADDLLKNNGQTFMEMMESLTERGMLREEEAALSFELTSEEDDDGDAEEEEDGGDEKMVTEEQRMEEAKQMFSIFAAQMFEQRVLQAYLERLAQGHQLQLLQELEDESKAEKDKVSKKQRDRQKKKEKKRLYQLSHQLM